MGINLKKNKRVKIGINSTDSSGKQVTTIHEENERATNSLDSEISIDISEKEKKQADVTPRTAAKKRMTIYEKHLGMKSPLTVNSEGAAELRYKSL
jgi:hypothetical protein